MNILFLLLIIGILFFYRKKINQKLISEWNFCRSDFKTWLFVKWKNWGEPLLIALVLAILIRTFAFGPYKIPTGSMIPTFMVGDKIFVDKISYRFNEPERGDIIVFKYPLDQKKDYVKRLVGLPGDNIEIRNGIILINGKAVTEEPFSKHYYYNVEDWEFGRSGITIEVPKDHYFVLGDNSAHSSDSRHWGFVPAKDVIGKAFIIWWPPKRIQLTD